MVSAKRVDRNRKDEEEQKRERRWIITNGNQGRGLGRHTRKAGASTPVFPLAGVGF